MLEVHESVQFDLHRIERAVREILFALGEDPDRDGLVETPRRVAAILGALSSLLRDQYAAGHRFFVGDRLSALDIYWAAFAALVEPLPADLCATPEYIRPFYVLDDTGVRAAADPLLLQHRDRIYNEHLELPVRL